MIEDIFADMVGSVHVTGNLIRLDLMTFQPHLKGGDRGDPVFNLNYRLIMPLEGFIQAFSLQENMVKQLIASGVMKKVEDQVASAAES